MWLDVYVFERCMANTLDPLGGNVPESPLRIYTYVDEDFWLPRMITVHDWLPLFGSLAKLLETYTLQRMGKYGLYWIGSLTWIYFFTAATVLQIKHVLQFRKSRVADSVSRV